MPSQGYLVNAPRPALMSIIEFINQQSHTIIKLFPIYKNKTTNQWMVFSIARCRIFLH